MRAARAAAQAHELLELGLERSFRTAAPVLDFVDRAIAHIGHGPLAWPSRPTASGPGAPARWCCGARWAGRRMPRTRARRRRTGSRPEREMANRVAAQLREWHLEGYPLVKA
jgi:ATP-dependent helicase/nuclease subunit A